MSDKERERETDWWLFFYVSFQRNLNVRGSRIRKLYFYRRSIFLTRYIFGSSYASFSFPQDFFAHAFVYESPMTEFIKAASSLEKVHTWLSQPRDNKSETQEKKGKSSLSFTLYLLFYFSLFYLFLLKLIVTLFREYHLLEY